MRHDNFISQHKNLRIRSRGRLPHWQLDDADYFVTFRLCDSLPSHIARSLMEERQRLIATATNAVDRARVDREFGVRLDAYLDAGYSSCILREDRNAAIVADALRFFDGQRYALHAWCVMPNHVHVVFHLDRGSDLDRVLHSWKSYTSHEIGRGKVWQREYFDRIVRDAADFRETLAYVLANPQKAGLRNWKWVSI